METIKIELTQEEAEVVSNYILRRMQSLENAKLTDSFCYPRLENTYYKIINNMKRGQKVMKKRRPRTSKYVGIVFDNGWKCTYCGIASVTPIRVKYAHRSYYYLLERQTSDGICVKQIRVNANDMAHIARGQMLAEDFANKLKQKKSKKATKKVNYAFN